MKRRNFLGVAGVTLVAGCSGDGGSAPTRTRTRTQEPTPTQSEPRAPSIESISLVSRWQEFGDANDEQVDAVGRGAQALIAFRHNSEVHDGTLDVTEQVRVFDSSGTRVDLQQTTDEQLVEVSGYQSWEHAVSFDTSRWDLGDYTAEALVRDNVTDKTSETASTSFRVNEPLSGSAAELVSVDGPDSIRVGERYEYAVTIENTSSRDGSVVSPVSSRYYPNGEWYVFPDFELARTIAAGETNTYEGFVTEFSAEGTVQMRIDDINETWRVDIRS